MREHTVACRRTEIVRQHVVDTIDQFRDRHSSLLKLGHDLGLPHRPVGENFVHQTRQIRNLRPVRRQHATGSELANESETVEVARKIATTTAGYDNRLALNDQIATEQRSTTLLVETNVVGCVSWCGDDSQFRVTSREKIIVTDRRPVDDVACVLLRPWLLVKAGLGPA